MYSFIMFSKSKYDHLISKLVLMVIYTYLSILILLLLFLVYIFFIRFSRKNMSLDIATPYYHLKDYFFNLFFCWLHLFLYFS